jgi:hypothetical protein
LRKRINYVYEEDRICIAKESVLATKICALIVVENIPPENVL